MSKVIICYTVILIIAITSSSCKAQEPVHKVMWSNEQILPFENIDFPSLTGDGRKIAFVRYKDTNMPPDMGTIWMANSDGSGATLLLEEEGLNLTSPLWFQNGNEIAFLKMSGFELWKISITDLIESPLTEKKSEKINPKFTPDGTKLILGLIGIDTPGIYAIDLFANTQYLIYATKTLSYVIVPFAISPDSNTIVLLNGQELMFISIDGTIKEKKTVKTLLNHGEEPIWTPDGKYIILGNFLYVLATGEELPFLPDDVVRYKESGKPDLVGPTSITLSKDGSKIAFVMEEPDAETYRAKIKIMDLDWK